jgi:hypothetical protein
MTIVFKSTEPEFAERLLEGEVFFQNLVSFKKMEGDVRADAYEGVHIDAPVGGGWMQVIGSNAPPIRIESVQRRMVSPESIFSFCTSLNPINKFGTACVQINDADEFKRRLVAHVKKFGRVEAPTVLSNPVNYYDISQKAPENVDITNPRHIAFMKRHMYLQEMEYRFVFALKGGYEIEHSVMDFGYDPSEHLLSKEKTTRTLQIGSIRDIACRIR